MKWDSVSILGFAALAYGRPQGVPEAISPDGSSPDGCSPSYDGEFQITIVQEADSAKRGLEKRECGAEGSLTLTLSDGTLKDAQSRTGYIASNYQFQFDAPAQAGAIYTAGWSVCGDGSIALGPQQTFYQCLSGDFYNLYDRDWAPQCEPVTILVQPCGGGPAAPPAGGGDVITTTIVTPLPDGQPQVITTTVAAPVTQITDGQIQAPESQPPVSQITDGQPQVPTSAPPAVTAPPAPPVSEIPDGQPQAPTETPPPAPPVSEIPDGQPQAPTEIPAPPPPPAPPVSEIPDGQPQAPTAAPPAPTGPPVSQIPDGQIQNPTGVPPPPPPANTTTPPPTSSPPPVAPSAGFKVLPGAVTALFAGVLGAMLYL